MKTFQNGGTWLAREHFSKAKLLIGSSYIRWPYYLFDLNEIKNLLFTKPKRNLIIPVMEISHFMVYLLVPFGLNVFREKYVFYITLYITLALYCIYFAQNVLQLSKSIQVRSKLASRQSLRAIS